MTPYRGKKRTIWTVKVPSADGVWRNYSSGTQHRPTARRIEEMVRVLGGRGARAWDVLARVHDGSLTLPELYDLWSATKGDIDALRAALRVVDVEPMVEQFLAAASCSDDTKAHYRVYLRRLIPAGVPFPIGRLTLALVQQAIDDTPGRPGTKRKAAAAIRSFSNWLIQRGALTTNPVRDARIPPASAPRTLYLDTPDATRLADVQSSPYREFSALLAGSGIEVSVALHLRRRDVDVANREVRARGTKTHARDRIVRVADWAWSYVVRAIEGKLPDMPLFDIPDRWKAGQSHRAAIARLEHESPVFRGYTMRDHRHTYAVRAMRAGTPPGLIARQLGHASSTLVLNVYGRFAATQDERNRWEQAATAMDAERAAQSTPAAVVERA